MARILEETYWPMSGWRSMIFGMIAGGMITGGLLLDIGHFFRFLLIIFGVMIFLDSIMIYGQDPYIATTVIFAVLSGVFMFFLYLNGLGLNYLVAVVLLAIFIYFFRFVNR